MSCDERQRTCQFSEPPLSVTNQSAITRLYNMGMKIAIQPCTKSQERKTIWNPVKLCFYNTHARFYNVYK